MDICTGVRDLESSPQKKKFKLFIHAWNTRRGYGTRVNLTSKKHTFKTFETFQTLYGFYLYQLKPLRRQIQTFSLKALLKDNEITTVCVQLHCLTAQIPRESLGE